MDIEWLSLSELYNIRRWTDKISNHNIGKHSTLAVACKHIYRLLEEIDNQANNIHNLELKIQRLQQRLDHDHP